MNNNSVQIPLNIGDEGGDQPPPYSPHAMETNEQPAAPPPSPTEEESERRDDSPKSPSPSPPPPRREEDIMVYNIPLPNQVVTIRLPRSVRHPQVEVIYRLSLIHI